ncbi:hypothetical protein [Bacillus infantis]|jgi:hypothetical protein|uniref:hypothetical protein n=1 Tax=Bacillus infantis TaxID=324767 RepID=UPI002155130F|nr:hypothetical protein [Bacillus infantis]MCR6610912.1 hypothetical protein [Bacillus infantis]
MPPILFTENLKNSVLGNQAIYKDSLFREAVTRSIESVKKDMLAAAERHSEHLVEFEAAYVKKLKESMMQQEEAGSRILQRLDLMENHHLQLTEIVEQKAAGQEKWNDQQIIQEAMMLELSRKMDNLLPPHGLLEEQENLKNKVDSLANLHEMTHKTIMERLDKQEDLLQKLGRHYEELRSVMQDRFAAVSSFLEDRFYKLTQPVQRLVIKDKQMEKEEDERTIV